MADLWAHHPAERSPTRRSSSPPLPFFSGRPPLPFALNRTPAVGIRAQNDPAAGQKQRTVLQPPQVLREGTKKTVFVNFTDLCKALHRAPEHVMGFLLAELGTTGSLDGQQRLIVKGRFVPKVFEGIFRRYVNEYVICSMCKASDTLLTKEQRLLVLRCQNCGASRSVTTVKQGFVARVGACCSLGGRMHAAIAGGRGPVSRLACSESRARTFSSTLFDLLKDGARTRTRRAAA